MLRDLILVGKVNSILSNFQLAERLHVWDILWTAVGENFEH